MDPTTLDGRTFGPYPFHLTADRVADFVEVTGDDPTRWVDAAPPGMAAAALFVVAPELLAEMSGRSVIHGEQTFTWHLPLQVGHTLEVTGTVSRVRERGGVVYVGFDIAVADAGVLALEGAALFLVTGDALPAESDLERTEPPHSYRGEPSDDQKAASRADLVRYAAATRDWNPIHWDHEAAVAAGLPGVVAHGLLQAAWALGAASKQRQGPAPLKTARVRFRIPLLPARPVNVGVEEGGDALTVSVFDVDNEYLSARVELADE